ncbi:MAG: HAMP domain-containing sensor histidine kinase [Actinomycetota bacterium]
MAGLLVAHVASVLIGIDHPFLTVARDVLPIVVAFAAGVICTVAWRRAPEDSKLTWLLFGAGCYAWAVGDTAYSIYEIFQIDAAFSFTLADLGYLALIPCWVAGLIVHPSRSSRGMDRLGTAVDAGVIMIVAATVTGAYVLGPTFRDADNIGGLVVALAYPIADLALLAIFCTTRARASDRLTAVDLFIAGAIVTFSVGDIGFARLAIMGTYEVGHPVDLTWTLAFVFLMFAAGRVQSVAVSSSERATVVPLLSIIGAIAMGAITMLAVLSDHLQSMLLLGAAIAGVMLIVRLVILIADRARIVTELGDKIVQLEESNASRERFIATVSHDLRTPLAAIIGFAELLQDPDMITDPAEVTDMTVSIERNGRRLARLTEDLLCAGQFASGHPPPLKLVGVDLRQAAEEVVGDLGRGDRVKVEGSLWTYAMADEQRVQQVLTNLIDNALKHSGSKEVVVRIRPATVGAILEVADHGCGIAPDRIGAIFDPFVSDFKRSSSAGLGLFVVASLVSAMGARISVTSEVGAGTTFTITFPSAIPTLQPSEVDATAGADQT